ncbi:putative c2h2 finger domain-containing protein [Neofusicoccum parvum UCRNP2]|uniref:Putative c2h2 finger domain-containing protein n=1 Tax=Botryosphaeria parva (strain UCR-NP2) TaxID=1287680 RepID=R1GAK7_BOTPV|nr:putative c2h2 finger domain-containing protein [Neofusicoccum parvum UCRNP2]
MEEVALGAIPRAVESDASSDESLSEASSENSRSYRFELDEESKEKGMCPIEGCGRVFTDLKAHMLTHVNERPEKCPITTCEYHLKGFARKYDRNRHTLTHYKGTMVCDFCPGSGSAAEKSFNRADVFKRHLTSVHGVEQTPPNSRKKSPITKKAYTGTSTVGTCSICSFTFANAQVFYEHLDECVLGVVQQADPAEAINKKLLSSIANDDDVKETLSRHLLPNQITEHTENRDDDEENNNHQFSYDDLQQAKMQSKEGFSGHDILNPLSEANKEPIFDTLRPRTIDQARVKERQKVLSSLIKQEPKRPALKSHKKKPKDMGAIVAPTYEHTSPVSARSQAVRMAKEQALTDQHHDHFDVPSNDIRPVPNFDRTMADIYTDNLFSPNITERQITGCSSGSLEVTRVFFTRDESLQTRVIACTIK